MELAFVFSVRGSAQKTGVEGNIFDKGNLPVFGDKIF